MKKTIIILAKSIKNGHFCIAGKDIKTHEWIRPVSTQEGGAITEEQSKLTFEGARSSYSCKLLHQAEISFSSHVAQKYHPENYLIDGSQWIHKYNYNSEELNNLLDYPNDLWVKETRIPVDTPVTSSLYFIKVSDLKLYRDHNGKRRTDFIYKNFQYKSIPCTDPSFDGRLMNDHIFYENAFIVLSLGEPYKGFHYKLVASIFT
ncbi:dual OB domain-containing protein [Bisgaard Taxon 45]